MSKPEEKVADKAAPAKVEVKEGANAWTYVGAGEDPPRIINFMGKQKFVRGELTEVTDVAVLAKLKGNVSFVNKKVDMATLHGSDEHAAAEADKRRERDAKMQAEFAKKHNKA